MKYKFAVGANFEVEAESEEEAYKKADKWDGSLELVYLGVGDD